MPLSWMAWMMSCGVAVARSIGLAQPTCWMEASYTRSTMDSTQGPRALAFNSMASMTPSAGA